MTSTLHPDVRLLDKKVVYKGFFEIDAFLLQVRRFCGDWSDPLNREIFERGR